MVEVEVHVEVEIVLWEIKPVFDFLEKFGIDYCVFAQGSER